MAEGLRVGVIDATANTLLPRLHPKLGWPHDPHLDLLLARGTDAVAPGHNLIITLGHEAEGTGATFQLRLETMA